MKILCGAWGRQCYHSNNVRNVFGCILQCSICVQKFIEFESIITELCSFMYLLNLLTQLVTSQLLLNQQFIFCTFLQITSELKEIVYYSNRPMATCIIWWSCIIKSKLWIWRARKWNKSLAPAFSRARFFAAYNKRRTCGSIHISAMDIAHWDIAALTKISIVARKIKSNLNLEQTYL